MDAQELVERCRRGEERAMGLLYSAYAGKLERVCRKYVREEADVQDIVHDSFVIIFTTIDKLKDARKLESWMCTIVRNLALQHLQRPIATSMEDMEMTDSEEESAPDYDHLMTIVEGLPTGYQNVLRLSVLEGLSHKEIAQRLGIEAHSSSSQLARAKALVRRHFKRYAVLLLALLGVAIPFLIPEKEEDKKTVAEETPEQGGEESVPDSTESVVEKVFVPARPRHFLAQQMVQDSVQTLVAEVEETDTTATHTIDTVRQKPHTIPDARPDDRLIAEDNDNINRKKDEEWTLAVSFAGGNDNQLLASAHRPGSIGSGTDNQPNNPDIQAPDTTIHTRTRHYMPLTFGLSFSKSLSKRWSAEVGLRYTLLRSDVTTTTSVSDGSMAPITETSTQKLHYIGIPLKLSCNLYGTRRFSFYGTGGAAADIPIGSSRPVLWSVNLGAGFQYKVTPSVSLYAEPSLNYYLNSSSGARNIRSDKPLEIALPVGLRLSW